MRFSIIIPYYDQSVTDDELLRCVRSLAAQTFQDFEALLFHDGPPSRTLPDIAAVCAKVQARCTSQRANDWGHSLRDVGIRMAKGDYIVHLNADNLLYPFALEELDRVSRTETQLTEPEFAAHRFNRDLLVFPIVMRGVLSNSQDKIVRTFDPAHTALITGYPPVRGNIDCMQLVMKRELWHHYGGWYDKSNESDGVMYPRFIRENGALAIGRVLGEHW